MAALLVLATGLLSAPLSAGEGGKGRPVKPDAAVVARVKRAIERAAAVKPDAKDAAEKREQALADVRAAGKIERFEGLCRAVEAGDTSKARALGAQELAAMGEKAAAPVLVQGFVREGDVPARVAMGKALAALETKEEAPFFLRHLAESEPHRRIRAMQGLAQFRDRRSVPRLVEVATQIVSGFGKAQVTVTTDRAYVRGWQLVSGGTGLVVVEVADPEMDIVREGVAMEVRVRTVEMRFVTGLLEDLTGESFGTNVAAWREWLAKNPEFPLAPPRA